MKTIKELEAELENGCGCNTCNSRRRELRTLKDVLELIDELPKVNHFGGKSGSVYKCVLAEELKARIKARING